MTLQIVQDEAVDEVLSSNPFALLCGLLLQQQVPIELAFAGPAKILERLGSLDPTVIASAPPEEFAELCSADPPIHPYPESMSVLIQALAKEVVANYGGDTAALWTTAGSGKQLLSRLTVFPGFNKRKAQVFIALLGKQLDVKPPGWEKAAGRFARPNVHLSVADVHDPESLEKVQSRSGQNDDSEGSRQVTSEQAEDPAKAERRAAKKAARKAARRAARQDAKERFGSAEGAPAVDPETGLPVAGAAGRGDPEKRAAKKAAKRAARRAAKGLDPEPPGTTGPGRGGRGKKKAGGGGNARKRAAAAEGEGLSDDTTAASEPAAALDASDAPEASEAPEAPDASSDENDENESTTA